MEAAISTPYVFAWSGALLLGLAALLKWKVRRALIDRRVNRGLRAYAGVAR
jgi:hypothetical protein